MNNEEFKAEIQPYYRLMYRVAASVLRNEYEAADAVHDAVLKLFERRNQLKDVQNVRQFCLSVVRNTCLNIIRDRKLHVEIDKVTDIEFSENEDAYNVMECKDLSDYVARVIERLPIDQKRVFQLSAFGGFSNAEIADLLGITQGNVRVILSRARKNKSIVLKINTIWHRMKLNYCLKVTIREIFRLMIMKRCFQR